MSQIRTEASEHVWNIASNLDLNLREQFEQKDYLESRPLFVTLNTGQRCNLQCSFCLNRNIPDGTFVDMNLEQFKQLSAPLEKASRVQLYGWGEPFLNANYETIFDFVVAHYPGIRIQISTNGTLLTDKWIAKLVRYEKCLINISLNAASASTYAQITKVDLFEQAIKNVGKLVLAKHHNQTDDFVISASFVAIKQNINELPRFVELCAGIGIEHIKLLDLNVFLKRQNNLFLGNGNAKAHESISEAYKIARAQNICIDTLIYNPITYLDREQAPHTYADLPADLHPIWLQGKGAHFIPERGECYEPWYTFIVMHDGYVYTCCRGREIMGNLQEQSFEEIWNSEKYRAYRRSINTFRPPQACRDCPVRMGYAMH
jgi:radical SAM protein with 4Fe4S-binding SPASM domain